MHSHLFQLDNVPLNPWDAGTAPLAVRADLGCAITQHARARALSWSRAL